MEPIVATEKQVDFTQDEKEIAARHHVEPKLVRLLNEIIEEHVAEDGTAIEQINQILKGWPKERVSFLAESLKNPPDALQKADKAEQEETEQPAEISIDEQTQERLKSFYKSLDPRTKLAILTLSEIQSLEGINFQIRQKEGKLYEDIWYELQKVCIETYHTDPDDVVAVAIGEIDKEDIWLAGVWEAVRMITRNI